MNARLSQLLSVCKGSVDVQVCVQCYAIIECLQTDEGRCDHHTIGMRISLCTPSLGVECTEKRCNFNEIVYSTVGLEYAITCHIERHQERN